MTNVKNWRLTAGVFLSSQIVSLFGSMLVQYAIFWYITLEAQSGVMMMLMTVLGFLPTFFLAPFAGVWADRYDRRKLIAIADGGIALVTVWLAVVYSTGFEGYWPLLVASFFRSLGQGIQQPAVGAFLPQFVPPDKLTRVNGIFQTASSLTMILAPIVAAALLSAAPLSSIFYIDFITAAVAIIILVAFVRVPPHSKASSGEKIGYFHDLKLGFLYVRKHPYLVRFFLFSALFMFVAAPVSLLTPLQVARSYGEDVWYLMAMEIAFFVGMSLGGIIISAWGGFRNRVHSMALAASAMGVFAVFMGVGVPFWLFVGLMGLSGLVMPLFITPSTVLLQEQVDGNYMGRVFGIMTMINTSLMPLGMLVFGPVADIIAIEHLLVGTGIVMALIGFGILASKTLVSAGNPRPTQHIQDGLGDSPDSPPDEAAVEAEPEAQ